MPGLCPTEEQLAAVLQGRTPADDAVVTAHLEACPACRQRLEVLTGDTKAWEARARRHAAAPVTDSVHLRRALAALQSPQPPAMPFVPRLDFLEPANQPGVLGLFSGYEVIEHVASGGMGIVLRARDPRLERFVALKILSPILAANELARTRFLREARAAAAVVHEHVVPIHAVDEWHGLPFLVMQFIRGRTLAERIRAGTAAQGSADQAGSGFPTGIGFADLLRLGAETAAGLAAAHAQGLVHRDIKPGNILLEDGSERVKLTDFGLARAADEAHLTSPGELAGTPEYMSPEQAGETEADARSDLFSLGVVLYAMVAGASPFRVPTSLGTMRRVCEFEPPPLHQIHPGIPRAFSDLVERLMAKDPASRIQTAAEVARQLAEWQTRPPQDALPATDRLRLAALAATGLAVLLIVGWWFWRFPGGPLGLLAAAHRPAVFVVAAGDGIRRVAADSLAGAIAASRSGDTIEIEGQGMIPVAPVAIAGKALRLRSAPGSGPVLVATNQESPLITTDAPLVVEGLSLEFVCDRGPFQMRPGQTPPCLAHHLSVTEPNPEDPAFEGTLPPALIRVKNGLLRVSHCRLFYRGHHDSLPTAPASCVEISGDAEVLINDSELIGLNATAIRWAPAASSAIAVARSLVLSNSVHIGRMVLNPTAPGPPIHVRLDRCTISASTVVALSGGMAPLRVEASNCLFDSRFMLHEYRQGRGDPVAGRMEWSDTHCHFAMTAAFVGRQRNALVTSLSAWDQLWSQQDTGSRTGAVRFPRMVGPTADLRTLGARHLVPAADPGLVKDAGVRSDSVGPGKPYERWRLSPSYPGWR